MKKFTLSILFMLPIFLFGQEQIIVTQAISTEKIEADLFVGYDNFGYLYYTKGQVFYKIKGAEIYQFKNVSLGSITRVDIINPLRIVLFYEPFNTVILLDNQLNLTKRISFSENSTPMVISATGLASQNRLWVFNTINQQIGLYDFNKNTVINLATPISNKILHYQSDYNNYYWIDEDGLVSLCDVYGKTSQLGKISEFKFAQIISNDLIFYLFKNTLYCHFFKENKRIQINIDNKLVEKFLIFEKFLIIQESDKISVYLLTI